VKDFKLDKAAKGAEPPCTELGRGSIDYHPIFAAARKGAVQHYFIEQEEFDIPPLEALKIDAQYARSL
jgi:sugar phosphate isomerase/epimerase